MMKKLVLFICGAMIFGGEAWAGYVAACAVLDLNGNVVSCRMRCAECDQPECVDSRVPCSSVGGGTIDPIDPPQITVCQNGQYKNNKICTDCPQNGSSDVGATRITQCYQPSGATFKDRSGNGVYTGDCYYDMRNLNPFYPLDNDMS